MCRQPRRSTYRWAREKSREREPSRRMTDTIEVEGERLDPAMDYVGLLRRQLKYGTVWNEVGDPGPEEGIWRLFEAASPDANREEAGRRGNGIAH